MTKKQRKVLIRMAGAIRKANRILKSEEMKSIFTHAHIHGVVYGGEQITDLPDVIKDMERTFGKEIGR